MTTFPRTGLIRLVALLIVTTATGCQSVQEIKQQRLLDETADIYVRAIRWGNYEAAMALIRPREGVRPVYNTRRLDALKVTWYDYDLSGQKSDYSEARMIARFKYYYEDSVQVREISNSGTWWYHSDDDQWYFDGRMPDFER